MSRSLYITSFPGAFHLAVTQEGTLIDFALWWPDHPNDLGAIFGGTVKKISEAMRGAFINIGHGKDGFLPLLPSSEKLHEGQKICVQITRVAQGGKGRRFKRVDPPVPSRIGCLQQAPTMLDRLYRYWQPQTLIVDSPKALAALPQQLRPFCQKDFQALPEAVKESIYALTEPEITLSSHVKAIITPTPALTAIDMDMTPSDNLKGPKQQVQLRANQQAIPNLCRQIRLRNLNGAIVIDLAGLSLKNRSKLLPLFHEALKEDPLKPHCLGVSRLGLVEIVRKRLFPSLKEQAQSSYGQSLTLLQRLITDFPQARTLKAGRSLIKILRNMHAPREEAIQKRGRPFTLELMPMWAPHRWEIA